MNNYLDQGRLVSLKELSDLLRISGRTIRRYIDDGILPPPIVFNQRMVRYDLNRTLRAIQEYRQSKIRESQES